MGQRGASLLEVIVVLALVSLLTATAADYLLAAFPRSERQIAVAELALELRAARQLAIRHRQPARVTFDAATGTLQTEAAASRTVWRRYRYADRGVTSLALSRNSAILFYPSGRTASPVTLHVTTRRGEAGRITVTLTGKVNWS